MFWEGPSVGFDWGGEGARTMMLVYNLPSTDAIYQRFGGIDGSAYFIGGFGMTALTYDHIVVVPIRSGVGFRLGANVGYLKLPRRPGTRSEIDAIRASLNVGPRRCPASEARDTLRRALTRTSEAKGHQQVYDSVPLSI